MKYASIMMGVYFAATGFGNKLAGSIGEASQIEPYETEMVASVDQINSITEKVEIKDGIKTYKDYPMNHDENIEFKTSIFLDSEGEVVIQRVTDSLNVTGLVEFKKKAKENLKKELTSYKATAKEPVHARLLFEKDGEAAKNSDNVGDGKNYGASFVIEETQSAQEYKTFMWITIRSEEHTSELQSPM